MNRIIKPSGADIDQAVMKKEVIVGKNCRIANTARFDGAYHEPIVIGDGVEIGDFTFIEKGVSIDSNARISTCVRVEKNCIVGENTFIGHSCVLRPFTSIGNDCVIGHLTVFEGRSVIGEGSLIQAQNNITRGVKIGKKVFIASMFCGANDPVMIHARRDGKEFEPVPYVIEDYVRIGIGVNVLPGVVIHKNAKIGAGAVVTKDVPENTVVVGCPACAIREVPEEERL
jgi:UDP-2-acetamido-3-amino-2,3-dideoxy-glucuronate N-acetyltransferase